jgi:hypothetical protein
MNASAAKGFARPAVLIRKPPQLIRADVLIALTVLTLAQSPLSAIVHSEGRHKTSLGHLPAEDLLSVL